jgi:hypothetical protein
MPPVLFALGIFQIGSCIYVWAGLDHNSSYLCFLCSWDDRHTPPSPAFIGWDGISQTFCLGWPQTVFLLISVSWGARIIGMTHQVFFSMP